MNKILLFVCFSLLLILLSCETVINIDDEEVEERAGNAQLTGKKIARIILTPTGTMLLTEDSILIGWGLRIDEDGRDSLGYADGWNDRPIAYTTPAMLQTGFTNWSFYPLGFNVIQVSGTEPEHFIPSYTKYDSSMNKNFLPLEYTTGGRSHICPRLEKLTHKLYFYYKVYHSDSVKLYMDSVTQFWIESSRALILKENGVLYEWGNHWITAPPPSRQDSLTEGFKTPHPILTGIHQFVAARDANSYPSFMALDSSGKVWAWGDNSSAQLGDGYNDGDFISRPKVVLEEVQMLALGYFHAIFVKKDGTLWGCGTNTKFQLGGNVRRYFEPVAIPLQFN
ncbi:MAG: hypothetical protein JNL74_04670 [Fibrobacteres bacterium]|nr:hypothetical protein [Fibrobacterota bacterium]